MQGTNDSTSHHKTGTPVTVTGRHDHSLCCTTRTATHHDSWQPPHHCLYMPSMGDALVPAHCCIAGHPRRYMMIRYDEHMNSARRSCGSACIPTWPPNCILATAPCHARASHWPRACDSRQISQHVGLSGKAPRSPLVQQPRATPICTRFRGNAGCAHHQLQFNYYMRPTKVAPTDSNKA